MRDSDWLMFPLIIVNFNHFFIQPAPEVKPHCSDSERCYCAGLHKAGEGGGGRGGKILLPGARAG